MDKRIGTQIIVAQYLVNEIMEKTNDLGLEDGIFLVMVCMLLEEKCKQTGRDVREVAQMLVEQINAVNNELGKY